MLENKRCIVFGGAGSIGEEIVRQLSINNPVYIFDIDETRFFDLLEELKLEGRDVKGRIGDVRDRNVVEEAFDEFSPDLVFLASAYKHVSPTEEHPEEAVKTNVLGTHNIISLTKKRGSKLINISTDKAAGPKCVMGMTKRIGEIMIKNAGGISVRFANVLGSRGSVIPIWQKQIDEKKPLTITHPDMERYFMSIPQAVQLVIEAAEEGNPGEILILDMGKPIKVLDLAKRIIAESGQDLGIKEIGIRPGEALSEKLLTEEENQRAYKRGKFLIIPQ